MKNRAQIVIIHGSFGSPDENWFPWLAAELRKSDYEVKVPKLPTPEGQNIESWRNEFERQVGKLSSDMILVGHSLAPGFILTLLEESSISVKGIFLVSGFLGKLGLDEFDKVNESFVCRDFSWNKIKQNAGSVFIYNSDNDPYVPLSKGEELATHLGVKLTVIRNGGHINASAGFTSFPQLLKDIKGFLG